MQLKQKRTRIMHGWLNENSETLLHLVAILVLVSAFFAMLLFLFLTPRDARLKGKRGS